MKKLVLSFSITLIIVAGIAQPTDTIPVALSLLDLTFDSVEVDSVAQDIREQKAMYRQIRNVPVPNEIPLSLIFTPPINEHKIPDEQQPVNWDIDKAVEMPSDLSELAFYPVHDLAWLIRHRKVTSIELTKLFIDRLKKYGDTLECVITMTDSLALEKAKRADAELERGIYRGPLHGIPFGAKDLLAVKGYRTTWGAMPYKDQVLDYNATVIDKLEKAGAVLVAKLTLGALAWGDVWYGGMTRNPWDLSKGSSGSSAGAASATVAGLVPFAIGSETWGSIVSPSTRCGATGLRPTFGRVSRHGAMALSWSMDKLGPICRNAIDCALVLDAIRGADGNDLSVRVFPFNYDGTNDVLDLRIGYLVDEFHPEGFNYPNDSATLAMLKSNGISLIEKQLPEGIPVEAMSFILTAEAGAAFDELTRSDMDTLLVRQIRNAWPNVFRAARLIPAVEYIQANRLRYRLTEQFNAMMDDIDVLIAPSFSDQLLMTNLTGHPCVVLPDGSYANGKPGSITLIGNHFDEASILLFARYLQEMTGWEEEKPPLFLE